MKIGENAGNGALNGLKVLELGQLIAGPFCGQLMADHGAEVIKIEEPGIGDPMRVWGRGKPVWWSVIARNKKSVTLNLRSKEGQDIFRQLVEKSDFLVENFRPGTMEKWGLGYDVLSRINPGLIMIRVSGYGQSGPHSSKAGYGSIGEAMGGMRYLAGDPSTPPSRIGLSIGDSLAATFACMGGLMALHHREKTGRGQVVDSAIYEAVLAMMESTIPEYTEAGHIRERTGAILPKVAPSNVYPTKDGELLIAANQDSVFARLAEAMGRPELAKNHKYMTHSARGEHQQELDNVIADWTRLMITAEVMCLMDKHGVPAGKIFKTPDMLEDAQYKARNSIIHVDDPQFKNLFMQNAFPALSQTPGNIRSAGPALGQHNDEILKKGLAIPEGQYQMLKSCGHI